MNTDAPQQPARRTVGMDLVAPYGVYVDGVEVGQYDTEAEAQQQFEALRRRLLGDRAEARAS